MSDQDDDLFGDKLIPLLSVDLRGHQGAQLGELFKLDDLRYLEDEIKRGFFMYRKAQQPDLNEKLKVLTKDYRDGINTINRCRECGGRMLTTPGGIDLKIAGYETSNDENRAVVRDGLNMLCEIAESRGLTDELPSLFEIVQAAV